MMLFSKKSKSTQVKSGYTLIEMLVTVSIIAVLASIAIASYADAAKSGRDGKRKADIEAIRQALVAKRADGGSYPTGSISDLPTALDGYISEPFPADTIPTRPYAYVADPAGTGFCLCAYLETDGKGNATTSTVPPSSSCNFGTGGDYYCATNP